MNRGKVSRYFAALLALLPLFDPVLADETQTKENIWRVGDDESGCYIATVRAGGMGITYSKKDQFMMYFSGDDETILSATPFADITIGGTVGRLPLQSIGGDGWTLDEGATCSSSGN